MAENASNTVAPTQQLENGKKEKDNHLANVVFNPCKSVTYRPIPAKQMAEVNITNNEKTPIIFKWKSTRPGMYKMRPVYGVLNVGEKATIRLFCKGVKDEQCPLADRYTCVLAASPSPNVNPENIWSNHKYQQKLAQTGKLRKVKLAVLYQGINDNVDVETKDEEGDDEKDRVGKIKSKAKKAAAEKKEREEREKKEDKKSKIMTATKTEAKKKKAIVMMFVRNDGESESGEDEDDKDDMKTVNPAGTFDTRQTPVPAEVPGKEVTTMKTVKPAGEFTNEQQPKK
ncbi:unnamed protein product [Caenorhabditis bovis]|uniref:Major sperm protein n=1 Tax=Caenorhabditis bovis TaxID=2654633 RepID=A0A8S1EB00_9PELO|nr:unnamed protein product [Caenorhabditis bovis]